MGSHTVGRGSVYSASMAAPNGSMYSGQAQGPVHGQIHAPMQAPMHAQMQGPVVRPASGPVVMKRPSVSMAAPVVHHSQPASDEYDDDGPAFAPTKSEYYTDATISDEQAQAAAKLAAKMVAKGRR